LPRGIETRRRVQKLAMKRHTDTPEKAKGTLPEVTLYTDGGCLDNPGRGGYGVVLLYKGHRKELSGGFRRTTNNRMEILAAIKGLEALREKCRVTLYSDSQYLVHAIEQGWAERWRAHGWWRNRKDKAINPDLWERLLDLVDRHEVRFQWIRGHAGNTENERADVLAREAALSDNLATDEMYERAPAKDVERLFWK
jgi:ribonuclease HI